MKQTPTPDWSLSSSELVNDLFESAPSTLSPYCQSGYLHSYSCDSRKGRSESVFLIWQPARASFVLTGTSST